MFVAVSSGTSTVLSLLNKLKIDVLFVFLNPPLALQSRKTSEFVVNLCMWVRRVRSMQHDTPLRRVRIEDSG